MSRQKRGGRSAESLLRPTPVFVDANNDGKVDLAVANDSTELSLPEHGDGTFEDVSLTSGFALNADGREVAAMGIGSATT